MNSADELVDVVFAEAGCGEMAAAEVDLRMHVVVTTALAGFIVIDERAGNVKERDHLVIVIDHECMDLPRRFEDIHAFARDPVMFQVTPSPFQNKAMHRRGM